MSNDGTKMWSGRFREPLDVRFENWQRSFPFDVRLLPQEIAASKAHAKTIAAAGILTEDELKSILDGLDQLPKLMLEEAAPALNLNYISEQIQKPVNLVPEL